jgi:hypothetical protein
MVPSLLERPRLRCFSLPPTPLPRLLAEAAAGQHAGWCERARKPRAPSSSSKHCCACAGGGARARTPPREMRDAAVPRMSAHHPGVRRSRCSKRSPLPRSASLSLHRISVGRGFMACPAAAPRPHHHPPAQHNLRGGEQGKGDGWSRREEGRRGCARPYAEIAWRSRREEGRRRWWWWSESGEGERRHWRGRRRRWWWQLRWGRLQCPSRMCVGRAAHT